MIVAIMLSNLVNAQEHTIEVHPNNRVASLLMSSTEYSDWITNDGFNDWIARGTIVPDIYKKFEDDFDFILLILNEDEKPSNLPYGQLRNASNDISGIGMTIRTPSVELYGEVEKLKAVMHLTQRDFLQTGPALHELMHNWGNYGIPTESVGFGTDVQSYDYQPHWGFTGGSTKGQLGGFKQSTLIENEGNSYSVATFGRFANGGNSKPYTELELYLMGMIPISDVTNFDVFRNITSFEYNASTTNYDFEASIRTTYTPESLETLLGTRIPSSVSSQKDFKLLVIVLTDEPLTSEEWNFFDDSSEKFGRNSDNGLSSYNFWEATNGLGTMETGNLDNSILGYDDEVMRNIGMYPNPTSGIFQIALPASNNEVEIEIFNIISQSLLRKTCKVVDGKVNLDIQHFPQGMYMVRLKLESKRPISLRIIKQ